MTAVLGGVGLALLVIGAGALAERRLIPFWLFLAVAGVVITGLLWASIALPTGGC